MSQWEKLIADILSESPNLRFDSIYKALVRIGYTPSQPKSGSSHYTFRKAGHMPITVPKHGPLKRAYVEFVAEAVQSYLEEETVNKPLEYYMNLSYRIEIVEDKKEGGYALHCPELNGCITYADTIEDGLKMLEDAKKNWFIACLEDNIPIPEPSNLEDYSGQFKLRMPKSLHKLLAQRSSEEGISMNQYCLYLLSKGI